MIPSSIGYMTSLTSLSLSANGLSGSTLHCMIMMMILKLMMIVLRGNPHDFGNAVAASVSEFGYKQILWYIIVCIFHRDDHVINLLFGQAQSRQFCSLLW